MSGTAPDLDTILTHMTPMAVNQEVQRWSTTHTITTCTVNQFSLPHQDGNATLNWDLVTLHAPGQQYLFHHLHHHGLPNDCPLDLAAFYRDHHMTQASRAWSTAQAALQAALAPTPDAFDAAAYLRHELDLPKDACLTPMGYTVCDCTIC